VCLPTQWVPGLSPG